MYYCASVSPRRCDKFHLEPRTAVARTLPAGGAAPPCRAARSLARSLPRRQPIHPHRGPARLPRAAGLPAGSAPRRVLKSRRRVRLHIEFYRSTDIRQMSSFVQSYRPWHAGEGKRNKAFLSTAIVSKFSAFVTSGNRLGPIRIV